MKENKKEQTNPPIANTPPARVPLPTQGGTFIPYSMDGTAHVEISVMGNDNYSSQIIRDAEVAYDLQKLRTLKSDYPKFLKEGKKQIDILCKKMASLESHTQMFLVTFLVRIGSLLIEIENSFGKKSEYDAWVRKNLLPHSRNFELAKQLARMGDLALQYRSAGKNRLIDFDRVRTSTGMSFEEILRIHPFPDTTQDMEGKLVTEHIDGIITYTDFRELG